MNDTNPMNDGEGGRRGSAPPENRPEAPANLKPVEVAILGALGGVVAAIVAFPNDLWFSDIRVIYSSAFCAVLGGIWSYVQIPEHSRIRAFQLGIVAPAAISALAYANTNANDKGILNPLYESSETSTQIQGELERYRYPAAFVYTRDADGRLVRFEHGGADAAVGPGAFMYAKKSRDDEESRSWWERVVG